MHVKNILRFLWVALALSAAISLRATERIPSAPAAYFNDYAGVVSLSTAHALNAQLEQYERTSSNQLVVAVYAHMESDSSIEDYTVRVAQAWSVGQKGRNNGAVLFVFRDDHKLYIQVGYGLEPVLTDALSKRIVENEIKPAFRAGDYDAGLRAGVNAMIAASQGEYKGTGQTHDEKGFRLSRNGLWIIFLIVLFVFSWVRSLFGRSVVYSGRQRGGLSPIFWAGGGGSSWSGGSGGGGGFSGGGGSFGGGGAGGSW